MTIAADMTIKNMARSPRVEVGGARLSAQAPRMRPSRAFVLRGLLLASRNTAGGVGALRAAAVIVTSTHARKAGSSVVSGESWVKNRSEVEKSPRKRRKDPQEGPGGETEGGTTGNEV